MNIEIDFEVFKALTARRETEATTYNEVIRKLLNLPTEKSFEQNGSNSGAWISMGVSFPSGTEFSATFKGKIYYAKIENGNLISDEKSYNSLSDAAKAITIHQRNGWDFWKYRFPNESDWKKCSVLKK